MFFPGRAAFASLGLLFVVTPFAWGGDDAAGARFFEKKVRPVLVERCLQCHGPEKQRGKLRLDSREALLRGGDHGPALQSGKPEESLLISAIRHGDIVQMPPKTKLPAREIADLAAWVKMGAPWPNARAARPESEKEGAAFTAEEKSFWAFQPPLSPPLPTIKDAQWSQSPIDHFILAGLEAKGLRPARPADMRTLIRRATFDLIGLPPTPEEISAFLKDESPHAFAKVIDSLLASPHYGERWGRHWLDVARYADSNGMDENLAMANAWRYRDYVITAFNKDKPYDQFVSEQIAGDLIPSSDNAVSFERMIATAFLCIGPKMLAEDDPVKMRMDIIDEQIDTIGRTFMGLTLGCARCHDHKFDPIRIEDYYGLAGIFKSTKTMDHFKVVARWHERPLASREVAERRQAVEQAIGEIKAALEQLTKLDADAAEIKRLRDDLAALEKSLPSLPEAMAVEDGPAANVRVHLRGNHLTQGREAPRQFPRILAGANQSPLNAKQSGRLQLAEWLTRPDHPLTARVMVNRIWRGHFGAGLVRSMDNFGKLGERPTNQPLLDYLACRFVESGWSIKAIHRLMMLSRTYQMSTDYDQKAALIDPENRLHWRMNRHRLEAEVIRDSLLAISGQLDRTMGGTLFTGTNRAYVPGYPNTTYDKYDFNRRSVYLPVIRSDVYTVLQAFDFPDPSTPSGERATTTVAPQALFMMNGKLVLEESRRLAENLLARTESDDARRVSLAYQRIHGRPPTATETARALEFVSQCARALATEQMHRKDGPSRAWQSLCRTIFASNEFLHVE